MRTLILASISLAATTLSPTVEACGVPEATVFQLSSHYTREGTRTFVVTGEAPTTKLAWQTLAPYTYDGARIAMAPDLARPVVVTLVGSSGTRVVSTRQHAFLDRTFTRRTPHGAFEIDTARGEYSIALAGSHKDAKWTGAAQIYQSNADGDWVKAQGVTGFNLGYLSVYDLGSRDLQAVTVLTEGSSITFVRSKGQLVQRFDGHALGIVEVDGDRFIVTVDDNQVTRAIWTY